MPLMGLLGACSSPQPVESGCGLWDRDSEMFFVLVDSIEGDNYIGVRLWRGISDSAARLNHRGLEKEIASDWTLSVFAAVDDPLAKVNYCFDDILTLTDHKQKVVFADEADICVREVEVDIYGIELNTIYWRSETRLSWFPYSHNFGLRRIPLQKS